ncbi:MAG: hypothetical protein E7420_07235 [Ruminococcaceae bacterium]|nr:hypothetical protein [Oscillospiraceae bacterium]
MLVEARAYYLGDDIVVSVGGGSHYHIGAVSIAVYEPERDSATVSTLCVYSHRDDTVSAYFAKKISREMKCTVSVSAGIHVDNASEIQIEALSKLSCECCEKLVCQLKAGGAL